MALAVFVAVKDMKDLLKGKMIFIYLLLLVASAQVHHSGTFLKQRKLRRFYFIFFIFLLFAQNTLLINQRESEVIFFSKIMLNSSLNL